MSAVTLASVLAQARQLSPAEQAQLTLILDRERAQQVLHLLDSWIADDSGYDEEAGPELFAALDRERAAAGMRTLFHDQNHSH